jgi:hypothetical protein
MSTKDDIKDAIDSHDAEDLCSALWDDTDCYVDHDTPSAPVCVIPGYAAVWYDDGSTSKNPGWATESLKSGRSCAISPEDLLTDLLDFVDMVDRLG